MPDIAWVEVGKRLRLGDQELAGLTRKRRVLILGCFRASPTMTGREPSGRSAQQKERVTLNRERTKKQSSEL